MTAAMRYLSIKNLRKYQHYKNRRPPWIKLHREVLSDYAFGCLQDASKAHLMLLWLLATEYDNRIPCDPEWLGRKLEAQSPINLDELVSAGFVEVYEADGTLVNGASDVLASRKQNRTTEERGERREKETELPPKPARASRSTGAPKPSGLDVLPKPTCDVAYERWVARIGAVDYGRFRRALLGVFKAGGDRPTPDQLTESITAFAEARDAENPKWRGTWTPEKWVGDIRTWVRLGGMSLVDEWGMPTERGKAAGIFSEAA